MAFLDYFNKKAADSAEMVKQQAKNLSEMTRLQGLITKEEQSIQEMYIQIGKTYLANHRDDYEKDYAQMIESIIQSEDNIVTHWKQIRVIKGITLCECGAEIKKGQLCCSACGRVAEGYVRCKCNAIIKADMPYCTNCGDPIAAQKPENVAKKICSECGREVPVGARFCPGCGNEILKEEPKMKKQKICPHCGADAETDQLFCTVCGEPLVEVEAAKENVGINYVLLSRNCPSCGAELENDVLFCTECGERL